MGLGNIGGFLAVALIGALWEFLVMSGMHLALAVTMMTVIMSQGYEGIVSPAACCATVACMGMALGASLRLKDRDEKALSFGYFTSAILGGGTANMVNGLISIAISFVAAAVVTYLFGFDKNEAAIQKQ